MSKFDLASILREQGGPVLAADGPELREISVELIDDNDGNFYSTENVSDLMDSISVSGVLQPILVTARPDGRFLLLAGHRRTKAVKALRAEWAGEGANPYDTIPAMVKAEAKTETAQLLDELALIQTNAAVRKLSDPELAKQTDRMTEILTALKEQGFCFPGRMREAVAKAVGVSSSKIGRLNAIRKGLTAHWLERWEAGQLTESGAEALARLRPEVQDALEGLREISPDRLHGIDDCYTRTHMAHTCKLQKGEPCGHLDVMWKKSRVVSRWDRCGYGSTNACCDDCSSVNHCKDACSTAKSAAQRQIKREQAKEAARDRAAIEEAQKSWRRLDYLLRMRGVSRAEAEELLALHTGIAERLEPVPDDGKVDNLWMRKLSVRQQCSFEAIYKLAKRMGLPPEAITDPEWEPEEPEPAAPEEPVGLVLVPKETEDGTVWSLADPDDFVPVGRWFAVTDGVQPPEGALVLILRFSAILADWRREPHSAIYRDGKWYHVEDAALDLEWKGVRYWSPWPEMEAEESE